MTIKALPLAGFVVLVASCVFAQTSQATGSPSRQTAPAEETLSTPAGHELSVGIGSYTYREPGDQAISIHGPKFVGEYAGTLSVGGRQHWFFQGDVRSTLGSVKYDGWCSPYVITPNPASPNGYALDIGDASPCSETGDSDWYLEGRALVGKDVIGHTWAWSPYSGVGLRHLSNGTADVAGYRTDEYLYVPVGITLRTGRAAHRILAFNVEFDVLAHGWQHTHDSKLGGGDVPATDTAPAFTLDSFSDVAFSQTRGWALRASAEYPIGPRWSLQPYYVRWDVKSSPVESETVTFTVNGITAGEQLGFYEPFNVTNEVGVKLGVHF